MWRNFIRVFCRLEVGCFPGAVGFRSEISVARETCGPPGSAARWMALQVHVHANLNDAHQCWVPDRSEATAVCLDLKQMQDAPSHSRLQRNATALTFHPDGSEATAVCLDLKQMQDSPSHSRLQRNATALNLSSRPERSVVEGSAVCPDLKQMQDAPSHSRLQRKRHRPQLVIRTGAKRSGEICSVPRPQADARRSQPLTTSKERHRPHLATALSVPRLVIRTGAKRSGGIRSVPRP